MISEVNLGTVTTVPPVLVFPTPPAGWRLVPLEELSSVVTQRVSTVGSTTGSPPLVGVSAPTTEATQPVFTVESTTARVTTPPLVMDPPTPMSSTELAGTTILAIVLAGLVTLVLFGLLLYFLLKVSLLIYINCSW